jgi:shikimate kinase
MERVEMDERIANEQGMSITEIFDKFGEPYFRDLESNLLIALQSGKNTVISCGGGVVMRPENADHMKKNGRVVLLTAKPETILERVKDSDERPILNNHMNVDYIAELMEKRRARYLAVADVIVETDGKSAGQITDELLDGLKRLDSKKK